MATDMPSWVKQAQTDMRNRMQSPRFTPRARPDAPYAEGPGVTASAVRNQTVARSHNTFRPDIYRVSEGYLN